MFKSLLNRGGGGGGGGDILHVSILRTE